ncbi:F-box domain [Cedratvirus A11]|uniref:F-box domain n=1 Tax=Cedratvirus A11 TaxID=1903266 RepID=A0A1M7XVG9_9VIRU|nr:F-box domain [Cedratvirus A11]SHO33528.1 F-box domain [Cedratvirus A11]
MQELPDEVSLLVLEKVPIRDLAAFCNSNKQYQNLCSDKYLWRGIFEREGLTLLEQGTDLPSWMSIYRASLLSREKADYVLSLYEKKRRPRLDLFKPIPLYKIRHVELLGEADPDLSALISVDFYSKQVRDTRELEEVSFREDIPLVEFAYLDRDDIPEELYLHLSKRGDEFIFSVEDKENDADLERVISKEEARDILYRLSYYGLLELDPSILATYKREKGGNPRSRVRLPLLTSV